MPLQWIAPALSRLRKRARTDAALARAADLVRRGAGVQRLGEAMGTFMAELDRARRYEHTLALAVLAPRRAADSVEIDGDPMLDGEPVVLETRVPGLVSLLAGSLLREALRESDILAYDALEDRFVIMLAQTQREDAHDALQRLERIVRMRLRLATSAGMALFPKDGLTMEDLLRRAEQAWRAQPEWSGAGSTTRDGVGAEDVEHANGQGAHGPELGDGAGPRIESANGEGARHDEPATVRGDRR